MPNKIFNIKGISVINQFKIKIRFILIEFFFIIIFIKAKYIKYNYYKRNNVTIK